VTEFIWPLRVYYGGTDHGGVICHANFVKFMERAHTDKLKTMGEPLRNILAEELE
jgi:acyl-CoA thioester hydrolase